MDKEKILVMSVGVGDFKELEKAVNEKKILDKGAKADTQAEGIKKFLDNRRADKIIFVGTEKSKLLLDYLFKIKYPNDAFLLECMKKTEVIELSTGCEERIDYFIKDFEKKLSAKGLSSLEDKEVSVHITFGTKAMSVGLAFWALKTKSEIITSLAKRRNDDSYAEEHGGFVEVDLKDILDPLFEEQIKRDIKKCNYDAPRWFYHNLDHKKSLALFLQSKIDRFQYDKKLLENEFLKEEFPEEYNKICKIADVLQGNKVKASSLKGYEGFLFLIREIIESADRDKIRGNYDYCVLKSYRALEFMVQFLLLVLGYNTFDKEDRERLEKKFQGVPEVEAIKTLGLQKSNKMLRLLLENSEKREDNIAFLSQIKTKINKAINFCKAIEEEEKSSFRNNLLFIHGLRPADKKSTIQYLNFVKESFSDLFETHDRKYYPIDFISKYFD